MPRDPIVEEVRAIREAYARRFAFELEAMQADLRIQEKASGKKLVRLSPRKSINAARVAEPSIAG